mgnify:CR=1 FL=1
MDYLLLVVGLALLLLGANYLVDSSVAIAKRAKISNFIIGLTIVGIGTSAPELFVSIQSALTGHGDIAMGNVVGSNITNLLLILGVTAVICPFAIEKQTHRSDIPFGIFAAVLLTMFVNDSWNPGMVACCSSSSFPTSSILCLSRQRIRKRLRRKWIKMPLHRSKAKNQPCFGSLLRCRLVHCFVAVNFSSILPSILPELGA